GGVRLAGTLAEAREAAAAILGLSIKGIPVRRVLVAPAARIEREIYLAALIDRAARRILVMASAEGGVEIEDVAATRPEAILRVHAHPHLGLLDFQARRLALGLGLPPDQPRDLVRIARGLVAAMLAYDADLVEINPLAVVEVSGADGTDGRRLELQCLDAKVTIDES